VKIVRTGKRDPVREKYQAFHRDNPHVYDSLVDMARLLKGHGHERYGIAALFETLRYQSAISTNDASSPFKLSNDYKPYYARDIMRQNPDLEGFFEIKKARADD
jgi:hypothetical protein